MTSGQVVVVGLAESPSGRAALRWAAEHARATGSELRAVHILEWPIGMSRFGLSQPGESLHIPPGRIDHAYRRAVTAYFQECRPLPTWRLLFDEGDIAQVLVREADTADLLVVGSRERMAGGRLQAGSLSHFCVRHAACPVVSVPVEYLSTGGAADRADQDRLASHR